VDRLQIVDGAASHRGTVKRQRFSAGQPPKLPERRRNPEHLVLYDGDIDNMRFANAGRMLGYRVQYRLHVTRRVRDYAQNVADRRLLLERLVAFADDPR
jgi:hypothetical protein